MTIFPSIRRKKRKILLSRIFVMVFLLSTIWLPAMPPHPDKFLDDTEQALPQSGIDRSTRVQSPRVILKSFPASGDHHLLILLVPFPDLAFDAGSTEAFYMDLFSGTAGGTDRTWRKYYQDMSNGALNLDFTILTVSASPESAAYYGENSVVDDSDLHPGKLVGWAIDAAIAEYGNVDFSIFDNDDDGWVDTITVVHAGIGEEASGSDGTVANPDAIWSHHWDLYSAEESPRTTDGVEFGDYTMQPEFVFDPGDSTIGVFIHEFGHVLGLPDLYDTTYVTDGIGDWGLMSSGAWLGPESRGSVPAPLTSWSRNYLGWLTVNDISDTLVASPDLGSRSTGPVVTQRGGERYSTYGQISSYNSYAQPVSRYRAKQIPNIAWRWMLVLALACMAGIGDILLSNRKRRSNPLRTVGVILMSGVIVAACTVLPLFTVQVGVFPDDAGIVADSTGAPFTVDPDGYASETLVSFEAIPATGFRFSEWQGSVFSEDATIAISMYEDIVITAFFEPITIRVTTSVTPVMGGAVIVSPAGLLDYGEIAAATATPSTGYRFVSWQGTYDTTDNPIQFTATEDANLAAYFELIPPSLSENRYTVSNIETSYEVLRVDLMPDDDSEYLLISNIVTGTEMWSEYLPGNGLMVLHIDNSLVDARIFSNEVNNGATHSVVVVEADGNGSLWRVESSGSDTGSESDLFAFSSVSELLNPTTNDGIISNVRLVNISVPADTMTVDIGN